ncbi:MAG: HAMP domain-containing protein [Acidobacteria bacterium]|nr:HAMP domain-containing protein [Acidobacteriota bacterium]
MRLNWRFKTVLPVACVLLAGLLLFLWITLSFEVPERRNVLMVAVGGALVICAALLVALAVLVQRPLVELQTKIARLRDGDLSVSASFADRNDEIGDLGRDFNEMVRQLRESRVEIERLHQTQMTRAEHLATLGELAAGLAHEIRNPLAGIAGVIEVMGRDLPDTSQAKDVWKEVQHEVQHIQQILTDLLNYARPKPPDMHPADLRVTAEHAVHLAQQQVLTKPIQIVLEQKGDLPPVEHDATQVQQMLLNLLLNAIQAIDGAGKVDLILEAREGKVFIVVRDTGRGIRPEQLPNIFRPFFTTKGQGTGLGLSLARRIVEAHNGHIEAASTPGQGTKFTISLPLVKSPAGHAASS